MVKKMCAKRFTDSKKWDDPWFTELPNKYKLMWFYMLDKCDHAGFFKVNKKMMEFCIGSEIDINEALSLFNGRITVVNSEKWFLPKFITFQYGLLKTDSKVHTSVLESLEREGVAIEWRNSELTTKDKAKDKDKEKEKDKDIIGALKANPVYKHIDIDRELLKIDAWLLANHGRKKTAKFVINWLNRIEVPLSPEKRREMPKL
jgi:hypothetical protein